MVFLNGEFIAKDRAYISVMDRGFLFGESIYEVIPVYHRTPFQLNAHLKRLETNLSAVGIKKPYSNKEIEQIINRLIENAEQEHQSIYLQISSGADEKRYHIRAENLKASVFIESNPLIERSEKTLQQGFKAITAEDIRWQNCHLKTTSLIANVMYAQRAAKHGVEEVLLLKDGYLTEGSSSNVFIVHNKQLLTRPADHFVLPGITRDVIIQLAKKHCDVVEQNVSKQTLLNADEIIISSSTRELLAIVEVDEQSIGDGKPGKIWQKLHQDFQTFKASFVEKT